MLYFTGLGEYVVNPADENTFNVQFPWDYLQGPAEGMRIVNLNVRKTGGMGNATVKAIYPILQVQEDGNIYSHWIVDFDASGPGISYMLVTGLISDELGQLNHLES